MEDLFQLTKKQAIKLAESGIWENWTHEQRFAFQFHQNRLCMDFSSFHKSAEKVFGRPIWTHEFARSNKSNLEAEYQGKRGKPTMEEIINLIPEEKRMIILM